MLVCQMNNIILYNTHITDDGYIYALGAEKNKTVNQAHHHHHQGQNRPHQKTITHPQGPPEPPKPNNELLSGSEGLIGAPLPHHSHKDVLVIELLLYDQCNQYQGTAKDKQI